MQNPEKESGTVKKMFETAAKAARDKAEEIIWANPEAFRGPAGPQGPQGPPGPQGPRGRKAPPGLWVAILVGIMAIIVSTVAVIREPVPADIAARTSAQIKPLEKKVAILEKRIAVLEKKITDLEQKESKDKKDKASVK